MKLPMSTAKKSYSSPAEQIHASTCYRLASLEFTGAASQLLISFVVGASWRLVRPELSGWQASISVSRVRVCASDALGNLSSSMVLSAS